MKIHQKTGILVTVLAMIITVNPIMALDNSQESINPYIEVYIIDQNKSCFAVDTMIVKIDVGFAVECSFNVDCDEYKTVEVIDVIL